MSVAQMEIMTRTRKKGVRTGTLETLVRFALSTVGQLPYLAFDHNRADELFNKQTPGLIQRREARIVTVHWAPFKRWARRNVLRLFWSKKKEAKLVAEHEEFVRRSNEAYETDLKLAVEDAANVLNPPVVDKGVGDDSRDLSLREDTLKRLMGNGAQTPELQQSLYTPELCVRIQEDLDEIDSMLERDDFLNRAVETIRLSASAVRALKAADINTVLDMISKTPGELLAIKGIGPETVRRIREILAEEDLYLTGEEDGRVTYPE